MNVIYCALCGKTIYFEESYSPADEAICAKCDTEVTGREHPFKFTVGQADGDGPTNAQHVEWANRALTAHVHQVGGKGEPTETRVQDLISDLFHLCDQDGVDVDEMLRRARARWEEER